MINSQTIEKMKQMKLYGMAQAFEATLEAGQSKDWTIDELLAHLIDTEWEDKSDRKINRAIRLAKFRYAATMAQIDYTKKRTLDKNKLRRFADCNWIKKKQNILLTGPTGVGKSYLACALGHQACTQEFKARYFNTSKLIAFLKKGKADGTYQYKIDNLARQDVLIIDDFGLEPIDDTFRLMLLEIIEDRYQRGSTVITTQYPTKNWHQIIKDPTISDAICDRLIHNAHKIKIEGDSMRKYYGKGD